MLFGLRASFARLGLALALFALALVLVVAAFVQPNDPAVDRILKEAAEILRRNGKEPALDGYRSGKRQRAWELTSAIWSAVGAMGFDYALPPATCRGATRR